MKSIFLIGKFNAVIQNISDTLSERFNVLLCSEYFEFVKGMLEAESPDLVMISLIGLDKSHTEIFNELKNKYPRLPVLCLGNSAEQEPFQEFLSGGQFKPLPRPMENRNLIAAVCDCLHVENTAQRESVSRIRKTKKKILLVDDNALQLRSIKGCLQENYDVTMATSGAEAIGLMTKEKPDLVFLDYEMPIYNGKDTLEMIRNIEGLKDIPVVFLTGVKDREHITAVLKLKPAGYLLKPVGKEKLLEIIHKLLET